MLDCMHPLLLEDGESVQLIFIPPQAPVLSPALLSSLEARLIKHWERFPAVSVQLEILQNAAGAPLRTFLHIQLLFNGQTFQKPSPYFQGLERPGLRSSSRPAVLYVLVRFSTPPPLLSILLKHQSNSNVFKTETDFYIGFPDGWMDKSRTLTLT